MPVLRSYLSSGKQMKHLHLSVVRHALRNMSNSKGRIILLAVVLMELFSICGYSQRRKFVGVGIVDTVLKYRKGNQDFTDESFNTINFAKESISGVKFLNDKSDLIKKFGTGKPIKKKFIDNLLDVDNPTIYYRNYIKYDSSLFEIDNQNKVCGFIIKDSSFVLDQYNIRIGEKLESLAKKLPNSFKEIQITENSFLLLIRLIEFECGSCSANIVLEIDRKSKRLISMEQSINY
jgi:hypothetical protein